MNPVRNEDGSKAGATVGAPPLLVSLPPAPFAPFAAATPFALLDVVAPFTPEPSLGAVNIAGDNGPARNDDDNPDQLKCPEGSSGAGEVKAESGGKAVGRSVAAAPS